MKLTRPAVALVLMEERVLTRPALIPVPMRDPSRSETPTRPAAAHLPVPL